MFDTLLESRSARKTFPGGAVASVTAHSALIAAAVFATAQARVQEHEPAAVIRVDYLQPRQIAAHERSQTSDGGAVEARLPKPIDFDLPSSRLPSIDVAMLPSISDRLAPAFPATKPAGPGRNAVSGEPTGAFPENEVEKPVTLVAGSPAPRYPDVLRSSGVEGRVVAVFVVDERGRAQV
ncbi:MAG TPA: hypothetical protein VGN73_09095, partial [Gemmatimonadaceae bacterium]|nr:hypothetical protein [Gemmatimonadaceae bacterium]